MTCIYGNAIFLNSIRIEMGRLQILSNFKLKSYKTQISFMNTFCKLFCKEIRKQFFEWINNTFITFLLKSSAMQVMPKLCY